MCIKQHIEIMQIQIKYVYNKFKVVIKKFFLILYISKYNQTI